MNYLNKTVLKSLEILQYFKMKPQLSLKELEELSQLPKSTLHRIVLTLEHQGFLKRDSDAAKPRFELGLTLLELGNLVSSHLEIRKVALPYMEELRNSVNEAVNLVIREKDEAIYIEKVDTSHPVRVYTKVGRSAPLYAGACPRVLLSNLSDQEIEEYFSNLDLKKIGNGTIQDKEELYKAIEECRLSGFTVSYGELETDSAAVAVPIRGHSGTVIAGLSIAGPIQRFNQENIEQFVRQAKECANSISSQMGFR
ncbi:IclR family transcriptional regulator [Halalkalibacter nanhaiisediminis]|uniref:IclR family transcriptional regulator n=1 Tax=Halalkalibacter nanhaiisediminis TaxID=688079 RepID=A0A562QT38_9BACI|nr:IclR family transcriptional regulator [Halalkalibacter nanhaiisediminis]TWI59904.1 IclR family transcriptional regulator [Halalkalibacter nanhaiisediminis]